MIKRKRTDNSMIKRKRTDNSMIKRKRTKRQTTIYKTWIHDIVYPKIDTLKNEFEDFHCSRSSIKILDVLMTQVARRVPLVEQDPPTIPKHWFLRFSGIRVARSLVFCVVFCRSFVPLSYFVYLCIACPSSDYSSGIFKRSLSSIILVSFRISNILTHFLCFIRFDFALDRR
jgi:hypothetical protein